ncbi:hypothetical protein A3Q56_08226, partial [Intoshia linei]
MKLYADSGPNFSVYGMKYLDESRKLLVMFLNLIDRLEKSGYKDGKDMFSIHYDFRYIPNNYMVKHLRTVCTLNLKINQKKITILTHSYGCYQILDALSKLSENFIQKHIEKVILTACPLGGTEKAVIAFLTGHRYIQWNEPSYQIFFIKHTLKYYETTFLMFPNKHFPNYNDVIYINKGKNYTTADIVKTLNNKQFSYYLKGQKVIENIFVFLEKCKKSPLFSLYCAYGEYPNSMNIKSFNKDTNFVEATDGDATVPIKSLQMCSQYTSRNNSKVFLLQSKLNQHRLMIQYPMYFVKIFTPKKGGMINPPVLCRLVFSCFSNKVVAMDGSNFEIIWLYEFLSHKSY